MTTFDIALEKRFTDSAEVSTVDVTSSDTLLIRDSATGAIMRLPFSTLASAISSAFGSSFAALVDGKVPSSQLPSYVDDVLEFANLGAFPGTGESGKIYVSLATNLTYRWSGSAYVEISASPGTTDSVVEGSTNKYYTDTRARAAVSATGSLSYNPSTGVFSFTDEVTATNAVTLSNKTLSAPIITGITDMSGGRLKFPATAILSSDPNTLDDYEEGAFSVAYAPETGAFGSITVVGTGRYLKVGKTVWFWIDIRTTGATTLGTAGGKLFLTGMPFTATSDGGGANIYIVQRFNLASSVLGIQAVVEASGTRIYLTKNASNSDVSYVQASELLTSSGNFNNLLGVFGMYQTAV